MIPRRAVYNRRVVKIITPPATLAVSLADVKAYLVIDGTADDAMLTRFIQAAQDAAKRYLGRAIAPETLELQMDGFRPGGDDAIAALGPGWHETSVDWLTGGGDSVDLAYPPVQSVVGITCYSRTNAPIVVSPSIYRLDGDGGRVYLNEGAAWPTDLRAHAAVEIRYIAGYAVVPVAIQQGIIQHVAAMYECRSACDAPKPSRAVMDGYRLAMR
jgi:hypothetical protein